ncbi:hypothetical protein D3C87_66540 [compost metagenome]
MAFYLIVLGLYLWLTIYTSLKISRSIVLSGKQKLINGILNALFPGIWFYLASPILFPKDKIITRDEREKMIRKETGSRLENNRGGNSMYY